MWGLWLSPTHLICFIKHVSQPKSYLLSEDSCVDGATEIIQCRLTKYLIIIRLVSCVVCRSGAVEVPCLHPLMSIVVRQESDDL